MQQQTPRRRARRPAQLMPQPDSLCASIAIGWSRGAPVP